MNKIISIYDFYAHGFKNMKVGKTLWKLIFIKLVVIFIVLKFFVHDTNFNNKYELEQEKIDFVYSNLVGDK